MKNLNFADVAGLAVVWIGAGGIAYLLSDPVVGIIAIAAGYYSSKWIILKRVDSE